MDAITHTDVDNLMERLPNPITFSTKEEIENLTEDQAMEVLRATRRALVNQLLFQEYHEHMLDDCGDDLQAATENWYGLWKAYFNTDGGYAPEGEPNPFIDEVKIFLLGSKVDEAINDDSGELYRRYELGGCDGEIRFALLTEELMDEFFSD